MKLYNSVGPNPLVVRMFMAERGISIPLVEVDLRGGENRREPYLTKNPSGQLPALELDDGGMLCEILPICEYLDEITPGASLIGATAEARARTRMWTRRIDLTIAEPMANGFRFGLGLKLFANRIRCIPEAAEGLIATAQDGLAWVDSQIAGREWICGDHFTLADILLFAFVDFGISVRQPLNPDFSAIAAWYARVKARPSAAA
jgi:glutathione S-transferase